MNFELFFAKYDVVPSQAKSIQTCNMNKITIPPNDQISIASEINLNPTLNHQIMKNGFSALKIIPVVIVPYF